MRRCSAYLNIRLTTTGRNSSSSSSSSTRRRSRCSTHSSSTSRINHNTRKYNSRNNNRNRRISDRARRTCRVGRQSDLTQQRRTTNNSLNLNRPSHLRNYTHSTTKRGITPSNTFHRRIAQRRDGQTTSELSHSSQTSPDPISRDLEQASRRVELRAVAATTTLRRT